MIMIMIKVIQGHHSQRPFLPCCVFFCVCYGHCVLRARCNSETPHILVMIRYQDFNFDTISIRYFGNIAISISIILKW